MKVSEGAMDGPQPELGRFIPFRKRDIVSMCLAEGALTGDDAEAFRQCALILSGLIHYEFYDRLETLKDAYAPVAADADTRPVKTIDAGRPAPGPADLVKTLTAVLDRANFE